MWACRVQVAAQVLSTETKQQESSYPKGLQPTASIKPATICHIWPLYALLPTGRADFPVQFAVHDQTQRYVRYEEVRGCSTIPSLP